MNRKMSKKPLTFALIGDSKVGKSELFRYLAEQCQEGGDGATSPLTVSVSVAEFKKSPDYPNCPDVVHFFRSESNKETIDVRANHTRKYWPTVAPSFETFLISDRTVIIYDLSGNPEFCRLAYAYEGFRNVDGFVLCYDMTSKESFDNLTAWHELYVENAIHTKSKRRNNANSNSSGTAGETGESSNGSGGGGGGLNAQLHALVPFVVVGTKADHEEGRKVAHGTVAEFCDISPGTRFFETSARVPGEGAPILRVFENLVERCKELESRSSSSSKKNLEHKVNLEQSGRGCADDCSIS